MSKLIVINKIKYIKQVQTYKIIINKALVSLVSKEREGQNGWHFAIYLEGKFEAPGISWLEKLQK